MTPVVLLTGFLGSGKTTLLSRLLAQPGYARTAVVINEFGETGLDHELIAVGEDGIVALTNGCLCCRVQTDLARTLLDLAGKRAAGEIAYDRLIIETSGLADPVPIVQALATDLAIACHYRIDRTVTVVDAVCAAESIARYPEARRQIAMADVLVLSKLDLAAPQDLAQTETALDALNRSAPRIDTSDPARLLDAPIDRHVGEAGAYRRLALRDGADHAHGAGAGTNAGTSTDTSGYVAVEIQRSAPVAASAVALFLEGVALHEGERLLRLKGIVHIAEMPDRPMVIHGVQNVFFAPAWLQSWPTQTRCTRIVMIGHGLNADWASALLEAVEAEVREVASTSSTH